MDVLASVLVMERSGFGPLILARSPAVAPPGRAAIRQDTNAVTGVECQSNPAAVQTGNRSATDRNGNGAGQRSRQQVTCVIEGWSQVPNATAVSYTHLRAHETDSYLVC